MTSYDAIVVGAGSAGLTAARDLSDAGRSVLVLEARSRLGGRTWTRALAGYEGQMIEMGGTYIHPSAQHNLAREIRRYDQPLAAGVSDLRAAGFHVGGRLRSFPVPPEEVAALERAIFVTATAARRINANERVDTQHLSDLDIPIEDFFAPFRLPAATREFIYGVIAGVAQCDVHQVSMLQWLQWTVGIGSPISAYFGVAEERLEDGTGALWRAMADDCHADFAFGMDVASVAQEGAGVSVTTVDDQAFRARVCVVAVPTQVLDRIAFSPALSGERTTLTDGTYVARGYKNFLVVDGAPRGFIGFGGFGGTRDPRIGWLYEDRQLPDGRLLLIAWGHGDRLTASLEDAQLALADYMPAARVVATDGHDWSGDIHARGINHFRRPGEGLRFASIVGERHGNVVFAGTDITPGIWSGWIEGGIDSGRLAALEADAVLRSAIT